MKPTTWVVTMGAIAGSLLSCVPPPGIKDPGTMGGGPGGPPTNPGTMCGPRDFPNVPEVIWKPLTETFEHQARGLPKNQWEKIWKDYLAHPKIPVRVAVVDVIPDQQDPPIRFAHTDAVQGVIRSLLCPEADAAGCGARVESVPGKPPRDAYGASVRHDFLTFREVYDSLSAVLAKWQPENEHLIVNFGVGWDPIKTEPTKTPVNDRNAAPIFQLLQRASCLGAIVIAPAGNLTGSEGPLFPAGYEAQPAPTDQECDALKIPRKVKIGDTRMPLVYAVGALDGQDNRMVTNRPWGFPRLAAYGMSVTSPRANGSPYVFSGTSMSAAIVSGVVASVWSAQPELTSDRIMEAVYAGGVDVDPAKRNDAHSRNHPNYYASTHTHTEVCLGHLSGPCTDAVHRVFLCGALAKVLPPDVALHCDQQPTTLEREPPVTRDKLPEPLRRALPCAATGCGHHVGPISDQLPNGAVPQPGISGCIGCALYLSAQYGYFSLSRTSIYRPSMIAATVQAYNSSLTNPVQDMGSWDVDAPIWIYLPSIPSDTWGAMLTVTYFDWDDYLYKTKDVALKINP